MCLEMAPVHVANSGIGGTALAVGGAALSGVVAFMYKIRDRIENIFRMR